MKKEVKDKVKKEVKKKENKQVEPDTEIKEKDMAAPKKKWWSIRFFLQQRKRFRKDNQNFLINMELSNGFTTHFIAYPDQKEGSFKYLGRKYIIDQSMKYYNLSSSMWCLDYHQDFSAPIQRKIEVKQIKDKIHKDESIEIEYATNPSLIEEFTVSKIAEGIMKGRQIDEFLKQIRLLLLICIFIGAVHLMIYLKKAGVF